MSIPAFIRPLLVALLLPASEAQAKPLVETHRNQEELRQNVAKICQSQFEKAQYHPVNGQEKALRYMISAKGVQAIKDGVVPAQSGASYNCDRGLYEQPMVLGRTYRSDTPSRATTPWGTSHCHELINNGILARAYCTTVKKEMLDLEPCTITLTEGPQEELRARPETQPFKRLTVETSCLASYIQFDDGLVKKKILAFRMPPVLE